MKTIQFLTLLLVILLLAACSQYSGPNTRSKYPSPRGFKIYKSESSAYGGSIWVSGGTTESFSLYDTRGSNHIQISPSIKCRTEGCYPRLSNDGTLFRFQIRSSTPVLLTRAELFFCIVVSGRYVIIFSYLLLVLHP